MLLPRLLERLKAMRCVNPQQASRPSLMQKHARGMQAVTPGYGDGCLFRVLMCARRSSFQGWNVDAFSSGLYQAVRRI